MNNLKKFKKPSKRHQPRGLIILYEDRDIIVVNKASGILTVSTEKVKDETAYFILTDYVRKGNHKSRNRIFIVHRLDKDTSGILVFAMACVGNFAFASATQGWFVAKNRFYEIPIFLSVTVLAMRPDAVASWIGIPYDQRYWVYPIALGVFGLLYILQRPRIQKSAAALATG